MREIAQIFVCFSEKPNFNVFHLLPFQFIHISATEKSCPLSTCFKFDTQIEMNWNQQGWNTSNYDCNNELSQFVIIVFFINMIKISIHFRTSLKLSGWRSWKDEVVRATWIMETRRFVERGARWIVKTRDFVDPDVLWNSKLTPS